MTEKVKGTIFTTLYVSLLSLAVIKGQIELPGEEIDLIATEGSFYEEYTDPPTTYRPHTFRPGPTFPTTEFPIFFPPVTLRPVPGNNDVCPANCVSYISDANYRIGNET
jgi:hypothetical protein